MKWITLLIVMVAATAAHAQSTYQDSLYDYQATYKKDLYIIIKKDTAHVEFYAPDPAYRVIASVELLANEPFFTLSTSSGRSLQAKKFARLRFSLHGQQYELYAYQLLHLLNSIENRDHFFIPFLDEGSGRLTYQGGRYIDCTVADIRNKTLALDFNKAYNPYCAFTSGYNCPIPPKENTLAVEIRAGEKKFAK